jgi:hypothetical protein
VFSSQASGIFAVLVGIVHGSQVVTRDNGGQVPRERLRSHAVILFSRAGVDGP